jgi:hypothetical protein
MKKLTIAAVSAALILAACGTSESQDASPATTEKVTAATAAPTTTTAPTTTAAPTTTERVTTTTAAPTTTVPLPSMRDTILLNIQSGDMTEAFRSDLYRLDRIDVLTADPFAGTMTLAATSGYGTRKYQIEVAQEVVYDLAGLLWTSDRFGDGAPVTFLYSQDGMDWVITGEQMTGIALSQIAVSSIIS